MGIGGVDVETYCDASMVAPLQPSEPSQTPQTLKDLLFVQAVVGRDASACKEAVLRFTPIIQRRVARRCNYYGSVLRLPMHRSRMLDLVQEVLVVLFERDARVLNSWNPSRGLSLNNFVGLVAEREVSSVASSARRSAWAESVVDDNLLEVSDCVDSFEGEVSSRDEFLKIWQRLKQELSPRALAIFDALLVQERSIEEVCESFDTTPNALYVFRTRIRERVKHIRQSLNRPRSGP